METRIVLTEPHLHNNCACGPAVGNLKIYDLKNEILCMKIKTTMN